ncbi:MAG: tryptophan 2,3-dioxygenase [Acidobacteria bacterium]|nr:tryptophan 2,3-dioxygenase [Acidobacteriota bacterium]
MASEPLSYVSYLKVDELLSLQEPKSDGPEHDEMLFIIIHQTYELWFKQILHELNRARRLLREGSLHASLGTLRRVRTIMKTLVGQVDILETMTPLEFNAFRARLESSSGFQSYQFREFEAVFVRPGIWDDVVALLDAHGCLVSPDIEESLLSVYRTRPDVSLLLEELVDIDEGLQEWRYRHVKMVERTIGNSRGTGGSSGAGYLKSTLFNPVFPELWAIRSRF